VRQRQNPQNKHDAVTDFLCISCNLKNKASTFVFLRERRRAAISLIEEKELQGTQRTKCYKKGPER
jgi:hypothetical protein